MVLESWAVVQCLKARMLCKPGYWSVYGCYVAAGFLGNFLSFGLTLTCRIPPLRLLPQARVRKDGMADRSEAISSNPGKGVSHVNA